MCANSESAPANSLPCKIVSKLPHARDHTEKRTHPPVHRVFQHLRIFVPIDQVRQGWKTEQKLKQPAWEEFLAVCRVLRRYDALKDEEVQVRLQHS